MNKAIFFDLQGTLGGEATDSVEAFSPYPFAQEALRLAKENKTVLTENLVEALNTAPPRLSRRSRLSSRSDYIHQR